MVKTAEALFPGKAAQTFPNKATAMRAGEATKGNYSVFPEYLTPATPADPKSPWILVLG
jgi:hypothetical protein